MKWRSAWMLCGALVFATPAIAQHEGHHHPPAKPDSMPATHRHAPATPDTMPASHAHAPGAMAHERHESHGMPAFYGPYPSSREASGTAWQPDSAPHQGWHAMRGDWSLMLHGFAFVVATRQDGPRGDDQLFSTNMLMGMATRPLGGGRLGARAMLSLEPLTVGQDGYPLLLQTGETADGISHLIDRQHPHDLFMELAATWSVSRASRSAFVYLGLPGEPALGPPAFMHRVSGEANPFSPIGHHWLDATHITFGVATLGMVADRAKVEVSAFRGREPDQDRWNIERPDLDSYSARVSWNPRPAWSLQASAGRIESPEQLTPAIDVVRSTLSGVWVRAIGGRRLAAMAAWGRNDRRPGGALDALLLEGSLEIGGHHTLLARAERTGKDELFPESDPRADEAFTVGQLSAGYVRDLTVGEHMTMGIGGMLGVSLIPEALKPVYDDLPLSASLFARARLK